MPESTLRWQAFNQRKPYFIATVFSLVLVAFAVGFLFEKLAQLKKSEIAALEPKVQQIQSKNDSFRRVYSRLQAAQKDADQVASWLEQRYYWGDALAQLREVLIRSEAEVSKKLSEKKPGVEAGIWIEQMTSLSDLQAGGGMPGYGGGMPGAMRGMPGGGFMEGGRFPNPEAAPAPDGEAAPQGTSMTLLCRAVDLSSIDPSANSQVAYAVENQLKACPIFDSKTTQLTGQITLDNANGTFTFGLTVTLTNSLKL